VIPSAAPFADGDACNSKPPFGNPTLYLSRPMLAFSRRMGVTCGEAGPQVRWEWTRSHNLQAQRLQRGDGTTFRGRGLAMAWAQWHKGNGGGGLTNHHGRGWASTCIRFILHGIYGSAVLNAPQLEVCRSPVSHINVGKGQISVVQVWHGQVKRTC
jgi:hypothetical protein